MCTYYIGRSKFINLQKYMAKFKAGSYYFIGSNYDDILQIVEINKNRIIWKRKTGKKFTSKYKEDVTSHQYFYTNDGKRVYSWNISSLHELRKDNLLKKLADELKGRRNNNI